jgi:hypothetical protein
MQMPGLDDYCLAGTIPREGLVRCIAFWCVDASVVALHRDASGSGLT